MIYVWQWLICPLPLFMRDTRPVFADDPITYACSGDSIPLFQNITIDSPKMTASLAISGSTTRIISLWTHNETSTSDGYSRKVLLEKCGNVRIHNVTLSDEAKYILVHSTETDVNTYSVYLGVRVSPSRNCTPKITRVDDTLSASVDSNKCGKPAASVYWLQYPNVQYISKDFIKLPPKTNAGTYYACIEGPAVSCVRNSTFLDYCSAFTVDKFISESSPENCPSKTMSDSTNTGIIIACIISLIVSAVLIIILMWRWICFIKRLRGTDEMKMIQLRKSTKLPGLRGTDEMKIIPLRKSTKLPGLRGTDEMKMITFGNSTKLPGLRGTDEMKMMTFGNSTKLPGLRGTDEMKMMTFGNSTKLPGLRGTDEMKMITFGNSTKLPETDTHISNKREYKYSSQAGKGAFNSYCALLGE